MPAKRLLNELEWNLSSNDKSKKSPQKSINSFRYPSSFIISRVSSSEYIKLSCAYVFLKSVSYSPLFSKIEKNSGHELFISRTKFPI